MADPNTDNTQRNLTLADAMEFIITACKRCTTLSMEEGVVLNASLILVKGSVDRTLAAHKALQSQVPPAETPKAPSKKAPAKKAPAKKAPAKTRTKKG